MNLMNKRYAKNLLTGMLLGVGFLSLGAGLAYLSITTTYGWLLYPGVMTVGLMYLAASMFWGEEKE